MTHTKKATKFDVRMPSNHFHLSSPLQGDFNIGNILCAVAVLVSQKIEVIKIQEIIADFQSVAGRLEEIPNLK